MFAPVAAEIDRVMKKVDEGVELFDDIWEKVYSAEQQNQKEKYEIDLKKEIKKLQRHRDQIKTWISSNDVKDKDALMEARKLIETKMEQFKVCEKETKTKTYSKEGLAREDKLDPLEESKLNTTSWLQEYIEKLKRLVEDTDFEIERLSTGKGKKTNKSQIEKLKEHITNHRNHISKMEGIIRLVNNDRLEVDTVDALKDDIDYYLESYEDDDYHSAYDEDYFYESLGLEELDVVNVDTITAAATNAKKVEGDDPSMNSKGSEKNKSKSAVASVIPLTIGRARVAAAKVEEVKTTPVKKAPAPAPIPVKSPVPPSPAAPQVPGASMAAILKRESEQQEKERLKAEQLRLQAAQRQQQDAQQRQQEAARQQQEAQLQAQQQEALKRQQEALRQQQEAAAAQQAAQMQAQQQAAAEKAKNMQPTQPVGGTGLDMLTTGLSGLGLGSDSGANSVNTGTVSGPSPNLDAGSFASALSESFATTPTMGDIDRSRQYTPQNPYPTPVSYPSAPAGIFENPAVFEKLGTDCLFFIFYYMQGTYQQYLAARELKKQSWRFHKKYMTWFQRHEEPKITTDEYEQGTYVYFDYETGWCTRIKSDFRFEYAFLEDSLQ